MSKPNHSSNKNINEEDAMILDIVEAIEYADGHSADDVERFLND